MTATVRFITGGGGMNGPTDSAKVISEQDLTNSATSAATTITAPSASDVLCVIYTDTNLRVAFGSSPTATTSAGPWAYSGVANAFRDVTPGDAVAVIDAT